MGSKGAIGAEGAEEDEGFEGAEEDEGAAIYIVLDGQDTIGQAIWLYEASEQNVEWMDTPQTVMTTRAPAVLKI